MVTAAMTTATAWLLLLGSWLLLRSWLLLPDRQQLAAVREDPFDDGLRRAVAVVLGAAATTARRIARGAAVLGEQLRHRALRTI
jgi:hypothetical protein